MIEYLVYITFATAVLTCVTALTGAYALWKGKKRDDNIMQLTMNVDGRLTELLEMSAKASHAEGKLAGAAEEKAK